MQEANLGGLTNGPSAGDRTVAENENEGQSPDGGTDDGGNERTFTKAQFERAVKDRLKKTTEEMNALRAELESRPSPDDFNELKAQLEQLREEKELAGKDALERAEHKHSKELEKFQKALEEAKGKVGELSKAVEDRDLTLKRERVSRAVGDALDRNKVFQQARGDALRVLMSELQDVNVDDNQSVQASWGDLVDESPDAIAAAFLQARPHYLAAEAGGAGSRRSNAGGGLPNDLSKLSDTDLLRLSKANRSS